jgi:hypothetical protein
MQSAPSVGRRDRDHARGAPLEQSVDPAGKFGLVATITDHCGSTEHEELSQIGIPFLRDFSRVNLATGTR